MRYTRSPELEASLRQLAQQAGLEHIDFSRTACVVSQGSKSRRTLARCHALPKIMQDALQLEAHYVIEIISENFFRLSPDGQVKTLLHELMHIPKGFGGGFRFHDHVSNKNVDKLFRQLGKPALPAPAGRKEWPFGDLQAKRTLPGNQTPRAPKGESILEFLKRKAGA